MKYFKEKLPPAAAPAAAPAAPLSEVNDIDKLIKTIILTLSVNNMENVMKLLGKLKYDLNTKALSLVIMASLTFINKNRSDPNIGELIEKLNEILGPSIPIYQSKEKLLKMVKHEYIKTFYS